MAPDRVLWGLYLRGVRRLPTRCSFSDALYQRSKRIATEVKRRYWPRLIAWQGSLLKHSLVPGQGENVIIKQSAFWFCAFA